MNMAYIDTFCHDLSPLLKFLGDVILFSKIALPIVLIIIGFFDMGKAVVAKKGEDVKKHLTMFFRRCVVCVSFYFVPLVTMILFRFVGEFNYIIEESGMDVDVCYGCLFKPNDELCLESLQN